VTKTGENLFDFRKHRNLRGNGCQFWCGEYFRNSRL